MWKLAFPLLRYLNTDAIYYCTKSSYFSYNGSQIKLEWCDPQTYADIHKRLLLYCPFNSSQRQILFVRFRSLPTQSYALLKGFTPKAEGHSYLVYLSLLLILQICRISSRHLKKHVINQATFCGFKESTLFSKYWIQYQRIIYMVRKTRLNCSVSTRDNKKSYSSQV